MLLKILKYRGFFNGAGCVLSLPLSFRAAASAFCCGVGCVRGGVSLSLSVCGVVSSLPTHLSPPPRPPGAERHPPHITLEERDNPHQVFGGRYKYKHKYKHITLETIPTKCGGSTSKCEGNIMRKNVTPSTKHRLKHNVRNKCRASLVDASMKDVF